MDNENHVTNQDILNRILKLEGKVDIINTKMEQATGAWFFVKIAGSVTLGLVVVWNAAVNFFK